MPLTPLHLQLPFLSESSSTLPTKNTSTNVRKNKPHVGILPPSAGFRKARLQQLPRRQDRKSSKQARSIRTWKRLHFPRQLDGLSTRRREPNAGTTQTGSSTAGAVNPLTASNSFAQQNGCLFLEKAVFPLTSWDQPVDARGHTVGGLALSCGPNSL